MRNQCSEMNALKHAVAIATNCKVLETKSKLLYDWRSVSQSVCLGFGHLFGAHDQILLFPFFFCRKIALIIILGHILWRKDGSVICSAICQWSESLRTHNHTLLSRLRLLASLSVASYGSQGLRWKYSYPPPHGVMLKTLHEYKLYIIITNEHSLFFCFIHTVYVQ
jgi:hypothetical protein